MLVLCGAHILRASICKNNVFSRGIRGIPRLYRENAHSTKVETDTMWTQVTTDDAGHQVKEATKEKWVENELMTRYLCNKLRQEHRRDRMMSGGNQNGKNVEFVGSERIKKGDDTLK